MKKSIHYLFLFLFSGYGLQAFSQCTVAVTPANISCYGANNGSANANVTGGAAPYTYQWSTGGTNGSVSNLAAGNYSVSVTSSSCVISGVELVNNGNFSGGNSGFSSSYSYCFWPNCLSPEGYYTVDNDPSFYNGGYCSCPDHTSGSGNMMIVNGAVTAGVSVWCQTIAVNPGTNYDFSTWVTSMNSGTPALLQFSINGIPLGGIFTAPATGIWQQFFAVWNSGANTSANICIVNQNTTAGGNDFALDDISFQECTPNVCTASATVTITEPAALTSTISATQVSCNGSNGSASVTPSGGTGAYTYLWSNSQATQNATGLTAGPYTVLITDNNGCTQTNSVTITQPAAFTSSVTAGSILCYNGTTSAIASVTGTTSPYTYVWSNNQSAQNATGLTAGSYTVTITDSNGCTQANTVSITQPAAFTATVTAAAILCNGGTTSAISSVSGGTSPYTYLWNNGQTAQNATGLTAGNYTVAVADAGGCPATQTISITQPTALTITATATQAGCTTSIGTASAAPSGGTGSYTYLWDPTFQTTQTATGLAQGNYTVTVMDANACTHTQTVAVTALNTLSVTVSSTLAGCTVSNGTATANPGGGTIPYTYNWSIGQTAPTATGLAAGTYTATVTDANGCTQTQTVSVTFVNTLSVTASSTQAGCTVNNGTATANPGGGTLPYAFNWNNGQISQTATGLAVGTYTVQVNDASGCTKTQTVTVTELNTLSVTSSSTQAGCTVDDGTATANPSSGIIPYTYNWNNGQTTQTATGLSAGTYTIIVTDANGCSQTQTPIVTQVPGPTATASAAPVNIVLGNTTQLTATGTGTYLWSPATGLSCTTCPNPIATPLSTTAYCATVTDANGCSDSACITINVEIPCGTVYIPNAFSPNNDGENDLECVIGNCITKLHIAIFNRWGDKVFDSSDQAICWDGTDTKNLVKGSGQGTAVFVYYMDATLTNGDKIKRKGNITLVR